MHYILWGGIAFILSILNFRGIYRLIKQAKEIKEWKCYLIAYGMYVLGACTCALLWTDVFK